MKFHIPFLAVAIALLPIASVRADEKKPAPLSVPPLLSSNRDAANAEINLGVDRVKTWAPSLLREEVTQLLEPLAVLLERDLAR